MSGIALTDDLRGVVPVVLTPFADDGSADVAAFERQLDFLYTAGIGWIAFGYGSEAPWLRPGELSDLMDRATSYGGGAFGVIGSAEVSDVPTGAGAISRIADMGAHVAMVRLSGLGGLAQEAVFETVAGAASRSGLPIIVQDAPQNTGVELSAATLARMLTEVGEVAALKIEPLAPVPKMAAVVRSLDGASGTILGGVGGLHLFHELRCGAVGTMPSPAFPEIFQAICHRFRAGDVSGAFSVWARVLPLLLLGGRDLETLLVVQKYLLMRRGVLDNHVLRPPHGPSDPDLLSEVDMLVDQTELWQLAAECGS